MHADHDQAVVAVGLRPGANIGDRAQAVDAGIGPEADHDDLAAQPLRRQRRRVQPFHRARQRRQRALDRQGGLRLPGRHRRARRIGHLDSGWHAIACAGYGRAGPVQQLLLERGGCCGRNPRQETGIQPERDRCDANEDRRAEATTDPLAGAERRLHGGEHATPGQQRQRERRRSTGRIGEQQQGGAGACALQRRAGQDQPEDRTGARRPEEAGRDAEQERRQHGGVALRPALPDRLGKPRTGGDQRPGHPLGKLGDQQGQAEDREQHDGRQAAILVRLDGPAPADRGERGDAGEGERHADEHRQTAAQERLLGAREHERKHRQDARADDRQHPGEIRHREQDHLRVTWFRRPP